MSSRPRLIEFALCAALFAAAGAVSGQVPAAPPAAAAGAHDERPLATRFTDAFAGYRSGDDGELPVVRELAQELAQVAKRHDVPRVVAAYEKLSSAERARGFALEAAVFALRAELEASFEARLDRETWEQGRSAIEDGIEAAWRDSREIADRGARAQASALRAEFAIVLLEYPWPGAPLEPEERAELAHRCAGDATDAIADFDAFGIVRARLNAAESLARVDRFVGHLQAARNGYEDLARAAQSIGNREYSRLAYEGMLAIARERGDEIEAEQCLEDLAGLCDAREDWPLAREWAMRLIHADRAEEAREFLDGFRAPAAGDRSPAAVTARRELPYVRALIHLRTGEYGAARRLAAEAAAAGSVDFEQRFLEARIESADGRPQEAIARLAEPALLASLAPRDEGASRTLLGEARLSLGDARGAKAELERALELADVQRRRALSEPLVAKDEARRFNVIGEWEGLGLETVALLVRAHLALGDPLAAALACEDWQSRSLRGGEGALEGLRARAGQPPLTTPLTRADLAAWAAGTELGLVTWVLGADSGAVVHARVAADGRLECFGEELGFGRETLREAGRRLRQRALDELDVRSLAEEITEALLPERTRAHIGAPRSREDRLLCLLHGPLEALPVELLGFGGAAFDAQLCLVTLPGLPAERPGDRPAPERLARWSLLGSPVDGADSEGKPRVLLGGAQRELARIAALRSDEDTVSTARFTRAELEAALLGDRCLHLATHLEAKLSEARSRFPAVGLRLDDGDVLTAREIAGLTPRLPLVILSACETGGGRYADGEGLFGVARAFLEGGTRNLVVTLWPVADSAAHDFSIACHEGLLAGLAPSEATRRARERLRRAGNGMADWAAFRFVGRD